MEMTTTVKKAAPVSTLMLLVICADAVVIVAACALDRASQFNLSWLMVPAAMLMTVLLGSRRLLGNRMALVLNDLIAIGSAMVIGPAGAVLATAANHLLFDRGKKEAKGETLFGIASSVVAMNAAIHAAAFTSFGLAQNELAAGAAVVATACCAVFYFGLASALSAAYRAFSAGELLIKAFKDSVSWNATHLLFTRPALLPVYLMRQWNYDESRQRRRSRIGEVLVSRGLITQAHLQSALDMQRNMADRAKRLGEILIEMGVIEERQILIALAERTSFVPAMR